MDVIIQRLKQLREGFDGDLDAETSVLGLLSDVCAALGLEDHQRRAVLGEQGAAYADALWSDTATLIESEHPVGAGCPEPA